MLQLFWYDTILFYECLFIIVSVDDTKITITIQPNDTNYYYANRQMIVECFVDPPEILKNHEMDDIDFTMNNSTFNSTGPRQVTINGDDKGTICFICGNKIISSNQKCYQYNGK